MATNSPLLNNILFAFPTLSTTSAEVITTGSSHTPNGSDSLQNPASTNNVPAIANDQNIVPPIYTNALASTVGSEAVPLAVGKQLNSVNSVDEGVKGVDAYALPRVSEENKEVKETPPTVDINDPESLAKQLFELTSLQNSTTNGLYFFKMPLFMRPENKTSNRICYNAVAGDQDPKDISEIQRTWWLVRNDDNNLQKFKILCSYTPCNANSVVKPTKGMGFGFGSFFKKPFPTNPKEYTSNANGIITFNGVSINTDINNMAVNLTYLQMVQLLQKVEDENTLPQDIRKSYDDAQSRRGKMMGSLTPPTINNVKTRLTAMSTSANAGVNAGITAAKSTIDRNFPGANLKEVASNVSGAAFTGLTKGVGALAKTAASGLFRRGGGTRKKHKTSGRSSKHRRIHYGTRKMRGGQIEQNSPVPAPAAPAAAPAAAAVPAAAAAAAVPIVSDQVPVLEPVPAAPVPIVSDQVPVLEPVPAAVDQGAVDQGAVPAATTDPNAAATTDPNAATTDPNAAAVPAATTDPNAATTDPNAATTDPAADAAADPADLTAAAPIDANTLIQVDTSAPAPASTTAGLTPQQQDILGPLKDSYLELKKCDNYDINKINFVAELVKSKGANLNVNEMKQILSHLFPAPFQQFGGSRRKKYMRRQNTKRRSFAASRS